MKKRFKIVPNHHSVMTDYCLLDLETLEIAGSFKVNDRIHKIYEDLSCEGKDSVIIEIQQNKEKKDD